MYLDRSIRWFAFLVSCFLYAFDLKAQLLFYVPSPPRYKYQISPLNNFKNTFVILQITNNNKDRDLLYTYGLWQSNSAFQRFNDYENENIDLKVVPYETIGESKYYLKELNTIFQNQVKDNCRNYFPTFVGKKFYFFFVRDDRREFGMEAYSQYEIEGDFDIPPNKSLYIEIDIVKQEHKTSMIDTPANVFVDMCK